MKQVTEQSQLDFPYGEFNSHIENALNVLKNSEKFKEAEILFMLIKFMQSNTVPLEWINSPFAESEHRDLFEYNEQIREYLTATIEKRKNNEDIYLD